MNKSSFACPRWLAGRRALMFVSLALLAAGGCRAGNSGNSAATREAVAPSTTAPPEGTAAAVGEAAPQTQPAAEAGPRVGQAPGELLADKSSRAGYGAERNRVVNQRDEIISVLKNGMTVIIKRVPSPVVSVRGYAMTGGVYEGKWLGGGLSHLLEHLVAGGSNARRTEAQNRDLLQRIGNNSNAYTSEDQTAFFVNTTTPHMEEAVDLVTGWMLTASITPAEYRREYQVVQRELEMGKGEPDRQFWYLTASNRYRVSPARVPVIGYQEVIQGLSRDDVYSYYKQTYQPNNMIFCVAGDIDPEQMLRAVRKNVADAPPGRAFSHNIEKEPNVVAPRAVVATFPRLGQARLLLGYPSVRIDHNDLYALDLLANVLGGNESSILVQELRDKRQIVSAVEVNDETPSYDAGTFAVIMQLDPEKLQEATAAALDLLDRVKEKGIDEQSLARAKTAVRAARVKRLQTTEEIAASLAEDYLSTGDAHFSDRYVDRIDKLTPEQVRDAARKYLVRGKLLTTALLPAEFAGSQGLPRAVDLLRPVATTGPTTQPSMTEPSPVVRAELGNGTVLLLKRNNTTPLVAMQMYALGGLTAEDAASNGLGNFTMQMLPRGTKTHNAEEIATFFDSIGGEMTSGCGNNSWFWNATCMKGDFDKAFAQYADVVANPAFPEKEVPLMKQRVVAQIHGEDADWSAQAFRYFKQEYFGPWKSPYQFVPIGTEANVKAFAVDQMRNWYTSHVLNSRRVLAIYGDVDLDKARAMAGQLLGGLPSPKPGDDARPPVQGTPAVPQVTPTAEVERVAVQKTDQELAGVVIGYHAKPIIGDPDEYALAVAHTITGGYTYPTGYLFETLRGRGLVYVVYSQVSSGRSPALPGTFFVFAGCDPAKVNEVVDLILENIARVQGTPEDINVQWFNRSKELINLADALDHETPAQQATTAALDELYGLGYDYHARFPRNISAVALAQVQSLARRRLRQCVVTISTPLPDAVKIKPGVRRYSSFPPVELTPRGIQHDTGGASK